MQICDKKLKIKSMALSAGNLPKLKNTQKAENLQELFNKLYNNYKMKKSNI